MNRQERANRNVAIGEAYLAGALLCELAAEVGLTGQAVFKILKAQGIVYIPDHLRRRLDDSRASG